MFDTIFVFLFPFMIPASIRGNKLFTDRAFIAPYDTVFGIDFYFRLWHNNLQVNVFKGIVKVYGLLGIA